MYINFEQMMTSGLTMSDVGYLFDDQAKGGDG